MRSTRSARTNKYKPRFAVHDEDLVIIKATAGISVQVPFDDNARLNASSSTIEPFSIARKKIGGQPLTHFPNYLIAVNWGSTVVDDVKGRPMRSFNDIALGELIKGDVSGIRTVP